MEGPKPLSIALLRLLFSLSPPPSLILLLDPPNERDSYLASVREIIGPDLSSGDVAYALAREEVDHYRLLGLFGPCEAGVDVREPDQE